MPTVFNVRPIDARATAFRAAESILRRSPALKRYGVVWQTWDGTPSPPVGPDTDRPFVELRPSSPSSERAILLGYGTAMAESPVLMKVRTRVPGSNWDNSISLFGLIEAALMPNDPFERQAVNAELLAAGVSDVETVTPAEMAGDNLEAEGVIKLTTYVPA